MPPFFVAEAPLSDYSTFKIGGPARWLAPVQTVDELQATLAYCRDATLPFVVVGKGSNYLFDDTGYDGVVLVNLLTSCAEVAPGTWTAGAGCSFARLSALSARQGWHGLEFAAGIPGTVGGAVYMNAGAHARETADSLVSVDFVHSDGSRTTYPRCALTFGYRTTPFQQLRGVIAAATFRLTPCAQASERQRSFIAHRAATQPYRQPSAGCIFRNPAGVSRPPSAGALIDRCGLKGRRCGGALVSTQHANFIVNTGGATASDVLALMTEIRATVLERCGIALESEVCYLPPQREGAHHD